MCGIVGIVSASRPAEPETVIRMRDTLRHRGPDDEGLWCAPDRSAILGHRRLAIIDLSPGGHQPMADEAGNYHIVFNGEIYNYRELRRQLGEAGHHFRSSSDTEVLLEAFKDAGLQCLRAIDGMFAFGVYDLRQLRLVLARDRAGEKPLFYRHAARRLSFASELKALFADPECPRVLDRGALDFYLAYGYVPREHCIVAGIRKLPQGHALTYDAHADTVSVSPYWTLPKPAPSGARADEELLQQLETLLLESVRARLIADVPVGVMLSGGIDSSLVTAMAARSARRIKTFTVSFPGHGVYDEAPHAALVARHFGTDHSVLPAEPATADLLPDLARQYDEPIADSSMVPTFLVSRLIRSQATVALGGDGGDELFGGYPHHSWIQSQARWRALVPAVVGRAARPIAAALMPTGTVGRNYMLGLTGDQSHGIAQFNQFFDARTRRMLLRPLGPGAVTDAPEQFKAGLAEDFETPLGQATATDFRSYLVDDILVKVDRASMLNSLEVRAPWLDARLIEFAFGQVPDRLRAIAGQRKILPRRLAAHLLPPSMDLDRKQGFSIPLRAWFRGTWGAYMRDIIDSADPALFDRQTLAALFARQVRGYSNTQRLFAIAIFELWRREYGIQAG